ncbi:uncharacterized protein G2W53_044128 [Senna tora]|uniref:Uncharacterized protein n=1 Tax=Senna tora TaxID=362788 RepID=A0A834SJY7_9FABA|nr:uncharacterized protein G2W53_044128 [Senna tora]
MGEVGLRPVQLFSGRVIPNLRR